MLLLLMGAELVSPVQGVLLVGLSSTSILSAGVSTGVSAGVSTGVSTGVITTLYKFHCGWPSTEALL